MSAKTGLTGTSKTGYKWICTCGTATPFGAWYAAHHTEKLVSQCPLCKRSWVFVNYRGTPFTPNKKEKNHG